MQKAELNTQTKPSYYKAAGPARNWYALYVASRAEKKVQEGLLYKNIEAYTPIVKTIRQWSDRKKTVEIPLLNGYVFVKHNEAEKDTVFSINGVVNYVRFDGKPAIISEKEIQTLKDVTTLGYETSVTNYKQFTEGIEVKITQGTFKGFEGTIVRKDKNEYLLVALHSIQQHIVIKLPAALLEKA
ncbi:MAG: UpxY family transcription antiterminator [Bacteroidetes bacterium]|nr:UpxY family transcription antiterminator [Bacteroidota bacterium]